MFTQKHFAGTEVKYNWSHKAGSRHWPVVWLYAAPDAPNKEHDASWRLGSLTCNLKGYFQNTAPQLNIAKAAPHAASTQRLSVTADHALEKV